MPYPNISRSAFQPRRQIRAARPSWKVAEDYKRWLRKLPCACCGKPAGDLADPIVAAHVDLAGGKGIATKVADRHCIPLRNGCHQRQHQVGWLSFEKTLPYGDAVALASRYWSEWPGRWAWERAQAANEQVSA